jgi:hypothetical protein
MTTRVNTIAFKGFASDRGEAGSSIRKPGDLVIIRRERLPRWAVLRCPSGCGDDVILNLDRRTGRAWSLYKGPGKLVSIYPSIWRDTGCGSHFIIWNNRVIWCDYDETPLDSGEVIADVGSTPILKILAENRGYISYVDIAARLDAIPWDVLVICQRLVRDRRIEEEQSKERGRFRLAEK